VLSQCARYRYASYLITAHGDVEMAVSPSSLVRSISSKTSPADPPYFKFEML
jgi:hypothetical protein